MGREKGREGEQERETRREREREREKERERERERGRGRERDLLIHSVDRLDDHLWRCGERGAQRGDRAPTTPSPPVKHEYPTAKGGCQDGRDGDGDHARVSTEE